MILAYWNGHALMASTKKEYYDLYQAQKADPDIGYVLLDNKNYIILDKKVIGYTVNNHRGVKSLKNALKMIDVLGGISVITERPTVEVLVKETENKNKVIITSAPKVDDLVAEGKAKMEEVVAESQVKTAAVRKKRRPVKKTVEQGN